MIQLFYTNHLDVLGQLKLPSLRVAHSGKSERFRRFGCRPTRVPARHVDPAEGRQKTCGRTPRRRFEASRNVVRRRQGVQLADRVKLEPRQLHLRLFAHQLLFGMFESGKICRD